MQSTIGLGLIEILLFLFGNGGLLGMPPGERDVAFLKAAPQQSLVYLEWAARGAGKPNAAGIDGFIADPEIQSVLKAIDAGLAPVDLADGEEDVGQHRSRDALRLAKLITAHAGCLFVTIDPPPAGNGLLQVPTPQEFLARVHIGAILSGGADCAAIVDAVNRTAKLEIPARPQMHPIPGPMGLEVLIHQDGERLLIGFGEQAIPRIQAGLRGEHKGLDTNPRFVAGWKQVAQTRVASVSWLDIHGGVDIAIRSAGPAGAFAQVIINGIGVDALDYVVSGVGVVDGTVVQRSFVATGGKTDGVLMFVGGQPLRLEQLAHIPADSDLVLAGSLNLGQVVSGVRELIGKSNPLSVRLFDETIKELQAELKLNLANDVFPAFGNAWTAFSAPSAGGLVGSGLIVAVEVRDHAKAQALYDQLLQLVDQSLAKAGNDTFGAESELVHHEFLGQKISHISGTGLSFGLTPSAIHTFCLTRGHLLYALHPQSMKAHLRQLQLQRPGFNSVAAKKLSLATEELLLAGYFDSTRAVQIASAFVPFLGQSMMEMAHNQGWKFDPFMIPSSAAIVPYVGDITLSVARTKDGVLVESRNPQLGLGLLSALVLVGRASHSNPEIFLNGRQGLPQNNGGLGAAEGQVVPAAAVEKPAQPPKENQVDAAAKRLLLKALVPNSIQPLIPDEVFRRLSEPPSPEVLKQREDRRNELEARRRERLERRRVKQP